jgi:hypothetical protein
MPELSTAELEKRMRPGAWSTGGFLGPHEYLEDVLQLDGEVLALFGVTHRRIADALEVVINAGFRASVRLMNFRAGRRSAAQTERRRQFMPFEPLFVEAVSDQEEAKIEAFADPLESRGDRCGFPFEHICFSFLRAGGCQDCPWGCEDLPWSNLEFRIENERAGEVVKGPGLIVHLIREHSFFEGLESPYRVNPIKLVKVLELRPEPVS